MKKILLILLLIPALLLAQGKFSTKQTIVSSPMMVEKVDLPDIDSLALYEFQPFAQYINDSLLIFSKLYCVEEFLVLNAKGVVADTAERIGYYYDKGERFVYKEGTHRKFAFKDLTIITDNKGGVEYIAAIGDSGFYPTIYNEISGQSLVVWQKRFESMQTQAYSVNVYNEKDELIWSCINSASNTRVDNVNELLELLLQDPDISIKDSDGNYWYKVGGDHAKLIWKKWGVSAPKQVTLEK